AVAFAIYAIAYMPSTLWMDYADRFELQLFLPLMLLSAHYIQDFAILRRNEILFLLLLSTIPNYDITDFQMFLTYPYFYYYSLHDLGERLAPFSDKHYTLMMGDVGNVPYYAKWKTYDLVGLANPVISHHGNSMAYMKQIHPDLIILYT